MPFTDFTPPFWLKGGNPQTIIGSKLARYPRLSFDRQRIETPDGDFIDLDWKIPSSPQKALVLFHGLEGSSQSHYAQSICHDFYQAGWAVVVAHFRSCSGEINRLARSYFSGDIDDVATVVHALRQRLPLVSWYGVGISMGGNVLLNYVAKTPSIPFEAVASVSAPLDLVATGQELGRSFFGRMIYTPYFMKTLKPKIREKHALFPTLIDIKRLNQAKTLEDFDNAYTAPMHGFHDAMDYWRRCSSKPFLRDIALPTLILNAQNDPFVPVSSLPTSKEVSRFVRLDQPTQGGHVGFSQGTFPHRLGWLSQRLAYFFNFIQ